MKLNPVNSYNIIQTHNDKLVKSTNPSSLNSANLGNWIDNGVLKQKIEVTSMNGSKYSHMPGTAVKLVHHLKPGSGQILLPEIDNKKWQGGRKSRRSHRSKRRLTRRYIHM